MEPVIVTAALVGSTPTKVQNDAVPITPEEIAESAWEAYQAGAAMVHIHVRNIKTQTHTNDLALFQEVTDRIRSRCDVVINLTTSYGATIIITDEGAVNAQASCLLSPEERVRHVLQLKPDCCSLDIATSNFGPRIFANYDSVVDKMALLISETETKPEIELFDIGNIEAARRLLKKKLIRGVPHFQLCMGTAAGMAATPQNAIHAVSQLPQPCTWSMFGIGRHQFPMVAMSVLLGGHVRVGLEDNLYLTKGVKAKSNAQLVEKAVTIIEALDRTVATAEDTRAILGL